MARKNILNWALWLISFVILLGVFFFYFIENDETITNFLTGLLVVFLMLAIATETFSKMEKSILKTDKSTKETVEELKLTNEKLNSVAKSLEVVASDVLEKRNLLPNLNLSFSNDKTRIDLRAGEECLIPFWFCNDGPIQANNSSWRVFFPREIQIVDPSTLEKEKQAPGSLYGEYLALVFSKTVIEPNYFKGITIKIKTERGPVGLTKIPFVCSCDGAKRKDGELQINFIG